MLLTLASTSYIARADLSSQIKYPNLVCLLLAAPLHHLRTQLLLLQHPRIFLLLLLLLNLKSDCQTALTRNHILILFQLGFLKNVHLLFFIHQSRLHNFTQF